MNKYIKLEPLLTDLEENMPPNWNNEDYEQGERSGYKYAVSIVEAQNAADVVEVKHGKWVDYADKYDNGMDLRCSICNKSASSFVGGTEDWWDNYKPNYCPNCGARMDGEDKK